MKKGRVIISLAVLAVVGAAVVVWRSGDGATGRMIADAGQIENIFAKAWAGALGAEPGNVTHAASIAVYDPSLDDHWQPIGESLGARVVMLIHGLDEPGDIWQDLAPALAQAGHTVLQFEYPNDQPIADSAELLDEAMVTLHERGVTTLDMVCHSMGGLVARDALTRPSMIDPARAQARPAVERLITLGTPHLGSPWAQLRPLAEIREQVIRWAKGDGPGGASKPGFSIDGRGEAGADLTPRSAFLDDLNARAWPDSTVVTCVVAQMAGSVDKPPGDLAGLERLIGMVLDDRDADRVRSAVRTIQASVGGGLGDGVVPTHSAAMPGATDIVHITANHRTMVRRVGPFSGNTEPPAIEIVLDRLGPGG